MLPPHVHLSHFEQTLESFNPFNCTVSITEQRGQLKLRRVGTSFTLSHFFNCHMAIKIDGTPLKYWFV